VRYLVRCACCDRAFWRTEREGPLPEHHPWERQGTAHRERAADCLGGGRAGYWIGEGAGPIRGWPREGEDKH
jgi:hypothetical protein